MFLFKQNFVVAIMVKSNEIIMYNNSLFLQHTTYRDI